MGFSWFGYGYRKRMFVDSSTEYIGLPIVITKWVCGEVNKNLKVQSILDMCFYGVRSLILT